MRKKLNVGVFSYDFYPIIGGQGKHIYELYRENQKLNKVNLFIFSSQENKIINSFKINSNYFSKKLKHIGLSIDIHHLIENKILQYNLDLVHIHSGPGGIILFKKLSVPTIVTAHHTYWQQSTHIKSQMWKRGLLYVEKMTYKNADKIICVSEDTKRILCEKYHIPNTKLVYIPNGIHICSPFTPVNRQSNDILYVGRIDKRKGVSFLISAMKEVNTKDPNIRLHVVGEGKDLAKIVRQVKRDKSNIILHGHLPDEKLNQIYSRVSLQVVPSMFEGFGITVLEAMSKKIPVIATNVDGIRTIIKDGYNGILVNFGDIDDLATQILDLVQDTSKSRFITTNAYALLKEYLWENIYFRTIDVYESSVK